MTKVFLVAKYRVILFLRSLQIAAVQTQATDTISASYTYIALSEPDFGNDNFCLCSVPTFFPFHCFSHSCPSPFSWQRRPDHRPPPLRRLQQLRGQLLCGLLQRRPLRRVRVLRDHHGGVHAGESAQQIGKENIIVQCESKKDVPLQNKTWRSRSWVGKTWKGFQA